jgi:hypothetical protein
MSRLVSGAGVASRCGPFSVQLIIKLPNVIVQELTYSGLLNSQRGASGYSLSFPELSKEPSGQPARHPVRGDRQNNCSCVAWFFSREECAIFAVPWQIHLIFDYSYLVFHKRFSVFPISLGVGSQLVGV